MVTQKHIWLRIRSSCWLHRFGVRFCSEPTRNRLQTCTNYRQRCIETIRSSTRDRATIEGRFVVREKNSVSKTELWGQTYAPIGTNLAEKELMFIVLGLFGLSVASVALLVHELKVAPEAYEDHNGFHIVGNAAATFKSSIFKTPRAENASPEKAAVISDKPSRKARRELGSVTSTAH